MKRLRAPAAVGWGIIICFSLSLIQPFFNPRRLIYNIFNLYAAPLQLVWLISSLILSGFIVGAWQVLQLKELGRSLIVFLSIIDIPHLVVGKAIFNNYTLQPLYLRNSLLMTASIILDSLLLLYFYHPGVRKQFR